MWVVRLGLTVKAQSRDYLYMHPLYIIVRFLRSQLWSVKHMHKTQIILYWGIECGRRGSERMGTILELACARAANPGRLISSTPTHRTQKERLSIQRPSLAGEDRVISCAEWRPTATVTHCRIRRKRGLRRTRLKVRVRSARNILPQHGMHSQCQDMNSLTIPSNECKRCKVKCIQLDESADCQRCSTMKVTCIVMPTATQTAKEKDKNKDKSHMDE
jgi:hypothetical protein